MKKTIGIIGGGNMGEAILSGIHRDFTVLVNEKSAQRRAYLKRKYRASCVEIGQLVRKSQVIILAVKPQDVGVVLEEVAQYAGKGCLFISIAAGISTAYIEKNIGKKIAVVRSMPNMPALIGEGMTAICRGRYASSEDLRSAQKIFDCVGETMVVQEKMMDSITAVSGSGPAYVFLFVECLVKAAKSLGFTDKEAGCLVQSTLLGSANLLSRQKESAAALRAKVTSKGGTTQAAMDVFFKKGLDRIITDALKAARRRAKELSGR